MIFIRDCQGNIVGNPKGYKTYKGAHYALKRYFEQKLWLRFYELVDSGKIDTNMVYSLGD